MCCLKCSTCSDEVCLLVCIVTLVKSVTVLGDINLNIIFFPFIIVIIYEITKLFIFLFFFTDLQLDILAGS